MASSQPNGNETSPLAATCSPTRGVATDALGRTMPTAAEVGLPKDDHRRVVGIFYIAWHRDDRAGLKKPYTADVGKILAADPKARLDAKHASWTESFYHWGEPELGYFLSKDEAVIRKDMSMLADAGVDVLVMDVTNAVRYWDEWNVIFPTMQRMKAEGNRVPRFCFWALQRSGHHRGAGPLRAHLQGGQVPRPLVPLGRQGRCCSTTARRRSMPTRAASSIPTCTSMRRPRPTRSMRITAIPTTPSATTATTPTR